MGFFSNLWGGIKNLASNVWDKVKNTATGVWNVVKKPISWIPGIGSAIVKGVEGVGSGINSGVNALGHLASGRLGEAITEGKNAFNNVTGGIRDLGAVKLKHGGKVAPMMVGGTHPYVMQDGLPKAVSFQR